MVASRFNRAGLGLGTCIFSLILMVPTTSWANAFTFTDHTLFPWITNLSLSLDHDSAGNVNFLNGGHNTWTTVNAGTNAGLDGTLVYNSQFFTSTAGNKISHTQNLPSNTSPSATTPSNWILSGTIADFTLTVDEHRRSFFIGPEPDCRPTCTQFLTDSVSGLSHSETPIPEPTTMLLFGTGLLGLAGYRWQQRRREGTQVA